MDNYSDIIGKERPLHIKDDFSARYPKMSVRDRAKIFSSFAALRGHSAYVKRRERLTVKKIELSPDDMLAVNNALGVIAEKLRLKEPLAVRITYFVNDSERADEGVYAEISGYVKKLNADMGFLKIGDENIFFGDIYSIFLP